MSLLEVETVSLKLRDSRGDEFAQEGVTMLLNSNGDGLNGRKPDNVDIVFILQKSEMPFGRFGFKPRIEPDIGDAFLIIKGVDDMKHDVRICATRNGASWVKESAAEQIPSLSPSVDDVNVRLRKSHDFVNVHLVPNLPVEEDSQKVVAIFTRQSVSRSVFADSRFRNASFASDIAVGNVQIFGEGVNAVDVIEDEERSCVRVRA